MATDLTAKKISDLNKMNRAAQNATLGTKLGAAETDIDALEALRVFSGSATLISSQMSASAVVFYNALATKSAAIFQVSRSGSALPNADYKYVRSGGSLTVSPAASGSFVVGDKISAIFW